MIGDNYYRRLKVNNWTVDSIITRKLLRVIMKRVKENEYMGKGEGGINGDLMNFLLESGGKWVKMKIQDKEACSVQLGLHYFIRTIIQ